MRSISKRGGVLNGFLGVFAVILLALFAQGCATEADGVMPWATPLPGEGSIPLPSSFSRE